MRQSRFALQPRISSFFGQVANSNIFLAAWRHFLHSHLVSHPKGCTDKILSVEPRFVVVRYCLREKNIQTCVFVCRSLYKLGTAIGLQRVTLKRGGMGHSIRDGPFFNKA